MYVFEPYNIEPPSLHNHINQPCRLPLSIVACGSFKDAFSCPPPLTSEVPLCVLGCTTYVYSFGSNQTKFIPRAQACVFVGYPFHLQSYKCFHPPSHKYFVTMNVTFYEDRPFFPISQLQGESVSEESNCTLESTELTPSTLLDFDPRPMSGIVVPEDIGEKANVDEDEARAETSGNEAKHGHLGNLDEYDSFLDIPIALRKCTRAFTASLDSTVIPKNIRIALESVLSGKLLSWKTRGPLKRISLGRFVLSLREIKLWDVNECSHSNTRQMEPLTDRRARSKEGISVSQRKYSLDLLTEIGDKVSIDKEQYQYPVGKLIYLSHTPNIFYVASAVSQFMQAPYEEHMETINKILRYLKTTPGNPSSVVVLLYRAIL
ncbi:reverse transcriptase [Cucumis melo var. makuwa]|uniref:Reverse transcriptase n=1 Tax=Cucumis melo var. makuwa TaxID=1194695 RepID=A0A5D3DKZ7_CUCMM|nr:reverse transcriptase [Cucumis melo var. makuwa]